MGVEREADVDGVEYRKLVALELEVYFIGVVTGTIRSRW